MKIRKAFALRLIPCLLAIALLTLLAACAAPAASETADAGSASSSSATASASMPVASADPASATTSTTTNPGDAKGTDADVECTVDADCQIKNVGNCCGYYPACVGKDTPVDPEGVKAQCQAKGMMGVCGFPAIESCQCTAGKCSRGDSPGRSSKIIPMEQ